MKEQELFDTSKKLLEAYASSYKEQKNLFFDSVEKYGFNDRLKFCEELKTLDFLREFLSLYFSKQVEDENLLAYVSEMRFRAKNELLKNYICSEEERMARARFYADFSFLEE